jgi:Lrp/AsnC family transcriptional regulator for asnA, asnC and gidA
LDDVDRGILVALQENARTPFSDIAKKLKVSEGTVHNRVRRMLESGVIRGFKAVVAPEKVGKPLTAIICINADPHKGKQILQRVVQMKGIYEVYDVTGEYYAVIKARASDMASLTQIIDAISSIEGITSTLTMVAMQVLKEHVGVDID